MATLSIAVSNQDNVYDGISTSSTVIKHPLMSLASAVIPQDISSSDIMASSTSIKHPVNFIAFGVPSAFWDTQPDSGFHWN